MPLDHSLITEDMYKRFLILGLDNAGKTTLVTYFSSNKFNPNLKRTFGMIVTRMVIGQDELPIMFLDISGARAFQVSLWQSVLDEQIRGVIYVIDASDEKRFEEQKIAFSLVLEDPDIRDLPILILANKLDKVTDVNSITARLYLSLQLIEAKIDQPHREIQILPISLKEGINIEEVIEWIHRVVFIENT